MNRSLSVILSGPVNVVFSIDPPTQAFLDRHLSPPQPPQDFAAQLREIITFMADTKELLARVETDLAAFNQDRTDRDALDALRASADAAHAAAVADLRAQIASLGSDNDALKAELEKTATQLEDAHKAIPVAPPAPEPAPAEPAPVTTEPPPAP
jgi:hypothetical protein